MIVLLEGAACRGIVEMVVFVCENSRYKSIAQQIIIIE